VLFGGYVFLRFATTFPTSASEPDVVRVLLDGIAQKIPQCMTIFCIIALYLLRCALAVTIFLEPNYCPGGSASQGQ
jgi:hypothetical protein